MNAYLKDFKQKMNSTAKGEDESLSLEDAAWHLSSLANYEFANANVERDDVRFDTLYAQVNITNGTVLLSDLAAVYQTISSGIEKFYNRLALDNKHFRFINAFISEDGRVTIPIITTFTYGSKYFGDTLWYFQDEFAALVACDSLFPAISYPIQTTGTSELKHVLNLIVSHQNNVFNSNIYYTLTSTRDFYYRDYIDPFGSPCYLNSRLYASKTFYDDLKPYMCYLLDSYLGLGHEYLPEDEYILSWNVRYVHGEPPFSGENLSKDYQRLLVDYGTQHVLIEPEPGGNDDD